MSGSAAVALAATPAFAATDGTLGSTSTGTLNVTATVPEPQNPTGARISGLQDFTFGDYTGSRMQLVKDLCVYHSSTTARLTVSQVGRPASTPLALVGPSNQTIPIALQFYAVTSGVELRTSGETYERQWNIDSQTCSTGGVALITAVLLEGARPAAGAYSGQFQLVIAPQ